MMTTNEIKKGTMVMLANGWKATIEDNKKGNIRMATVYGLYTEMGSVYGHDIKYAYIGPKMVVIEHTQAQKNSRRMNENMGC